jgi:hypothetical protein
MDAIFDLDSPLTRSRGVSHESGDLEFAYDWGLELSTRMPVARALELAKWARISFGQEVQLENDYLSSPSRQLSPLAEYTELSEEEDRFAQPLRELQEALAVLQQASDSNATRSSGVGEQDTAFAGPIADLQKALTLMTPQMPSLEEYDAEDAFAGPIADLQNVLAQLSSPESSLLTTADIETESADESFIEPVADLEKLLTAQSDISQIDLDQASPHERNELKDTPVLLTDNVVTVQTNYVGIGLASVALQHGSQSLRSSVWRKYAG